MHRLYNITRKIPSNKPILYKFIIGSAAFSLFGISTVEAKEIKQNIPLNSTNIHRSNDGNYIEYTNNGKKYKERIIVDKKAIDPWAPCEAKIIINSKGVFVDNEKTDLIIEGAAAKFSNFMDNLVKIAEEEVPKRIIPAISDGINRTNYDIQNGKSNRNAIGNGIFTAVKTLITGERDVIKDENNDDESNSSSPTKNKIIEETIKIVTNESQPTETIKNLTVDGINKIIKSTEKKEKKETDKDEKK